MTLEEYLKWTGMAVPSITKLQAALIGTQWPLQDGWYSKFKEKDVGSGEEFLSAASKNVKARMGVLPAQEAFRKKQNKKKYTRPPKPNGKAESYGKDFILSTDFYKSREWRELRYQFIVTQDGRCACCGRCSKQGIVLHVDHIYPRSKYWKLALNEDNLQLLCEDCNLGKSNKDTTDWR